MTIIITDRYEYITMKDDQRVCPSGRTMFKSLSFNEKLNYIEIVCKKNSKTEDINVICT